jgi:hypothetical protein
MLFLYKSRGAFPRLEPSLVRRSEIASQLTARLIKSEIKSMIFFSFGAPEMMMHTRT